MSRAPAVVVRTTGFTWLDKVGQLVVACMFPIGVLWVIYLSGPPSPSDVVPRLVGVIAFLAAVDLAWVSIVSVRRVEIDTEGVSFRYLFHTERRNWSDLRPGSGPPEHRDWWLRSTFHIGRNSFERGYHISIEQAKSILGHPSCPKWDLAPKVRQGLEAAGVRLT